ncbi:hypothetical protein TrLO_g353 [Triparma laevis f. longispina]|uniref:SET domain-containing protein n=1 Tax=Triparma laevis f. longispina TaxID=1714387 RepID=A0A9W7C9J3_9STRA|nr:hypothetical protein TrLO_g353 [Triparma laevis f. longispina]
MEPEPKQIRSYLEEMSKRSSALSSSSFDDLLAYAEPFAPSVTISNPPNRCLIANTPATANEPFLSIPFSKLITPDTPLAFLSQVNSLRPPQTQTTTHTHQLITNSDLAIILNLLSLPQTHAYKKLLPSQSEFDAILPVTWSSSTLSSNLKGSSALISEIESLKSSLSSLFSSVISKLSSPTTTFTDFLHAYCCISSRSFSIKDAADPNAPPTPALLPLIDMCNHKRPRVCSYKKHGDRVVLTALIDLKPGDEVSITYGAKSSSELLRDYGFALGSEENTEPDGSSNDCVKITIRDNFLVSFRAPGGGASYSYFCLSEGVNAVREKAEEGEADFGFSGGENGATSFEDFEEGDEEGEDDDFFGDDDDDENDGPDLLDIVERVALLESTLTTSLSNYDSPPTSSSPSCLIVLDNDVRIIKFYVKVCKAILKIAELVSKEVSVDEISKYLEEMKNMTEINEWEAVVAFCKLKLALSKYFC